MTPKAGMECGWAHSLPVKLECLCGSRPCFLPGDLSRDRAAEFLRLQIPQTLLVNTPDGVRSSDGPGLSRQPHASQRSHHCSSRGLFTPFPAHALHLCRNTPPLEFLFCAYHFVATFIILMLKYFAFLKIQI